MSYISDLSEERKEKAAIAPLPLSILCFTHETIYTGYRKFSTAYSILQETPGNFAIWVIEKSPKTLYIFPPTISLYETDESSQEALGVIHQLIETFEKEVNLQHHVVHLPT
jgi:hypothetical protein